MTLEEKVKRIVVDSLHVDPEMVTPEASFVNDLGADSLDFAELVMNFEDEFKAYIADNISEVDAAKFQTVGSVVAYLKTCGIPEHFTESHLGLAPMVPISTSPQSGKSEPLLKCFSVNEDKIEGAELLSAEIGDDKWYGFSCVAKDDDGDFLKYSFYLLPEGEDCSSGLVFCYLGDCDGLSDFVHKINSDNIANCWKAWPLLMQAIKNGLEDNYSRDDAPALICYGTNQMWGMATRYENVDFEQLAAHLNDKRIDSNLAYLFKKAINATNYAMRMLVEVDENDISVMDGIVSGLKSIWNGYQTGRAIQNGLDFISKFL